jgi:uncharacterized protein
MNATNYVAFADSHCLAGGELTSVVKQAKIALDINPQSTIFIFNDLTSELFEIDFRGTLDEVLERLANTSTYEAANPLGEKEPRGPGRPKLGVMAREVTLLPRHWDWLNLQPGGASVALRKLVEKARHENAGKDRVRQAQESSYRFMSTLAVNLPSYEEALRALFAGNQARFDELISPWPRDIRNHAQKLASSAFPALQ